MVVKKQGCDDIKCLILSDMHIVRTHFAQVLICTYIFHLTALKLSYGEINKAIYLVVLKEAALS